MRFQRFLKNDFFRDPNKFTFWELLETINSKPIPNLGKKYSDDFKDFIAKWYFILYHNINFYSKKIDFSLQKDPKIRLNAAELLVLLIKSSLFYPKFFVET